MAQMAKNLPPNAGEPGLVPGMGRSPRGGHGYLLQSSYFKRWAVVHKVTTTQIQLSD